MFESVMKDPGADALERVSRIFHILTILACVGVLLRILQLIAGPDILHVVLLALGIAGAALAFITARGIDAQRSWAKVLAYVQGFVWLFNFPIGTVIGIAVLIYTRRASKAGLFKTA